MYRPLTTKGFTLVEILFTITILVIILSFVIGAFQKYARFQQYEQAVSTVQFALDQTRRSARSATGDASHGVKFTASSITQFTGDTYVAGDPENIVNAYQLVTLQYDLTGGADEVLFAKLTGLPSATGTVKITGVGYNASTTLTVTATGIVQ